MKIELISPPHYESVEDRLDHPIGLMYIGSYVKENSSHIVRVNDLAGVPNEEWDIGFAEIYGITTYTPTHEYVREIVKKAKEKNPAAIVVAGGAFASALPRFHLDNGFDSVVKGEGELALLDLINDFPNVKETYEAPLEKNLDVYPDSDRRLIDMYSYKRKVGGKLSFPILTTRGCPFYCSFCGLPDTHRTVKKRSVERIVQEIKEIQETYGVNHFNILDDLFTFDRKRLERMTEGFRSRGIIYKAHGRIGVNNLDDFKKLKESGCDMLTFGVESGSQKMLNKMQKGFRVEDIYRDVEQAKKAGLTVRYDLIGGFPGETEKTVEETIRMIQDTQPDQLFVSNFVPYPGTKVWKNPEEFGITEMSRDFTQYFQIDGTGTGGVVFSTKDSDSLEITTLIAKLREFTDNYRFRGNLQEYELNLDKAQNE